MIQLITCKFICCTLSPPVRNVQVTCRSKFGKLYFMFIPCTFNNGIFISRVHITNHVIERWFLGKRTDVVPPRMSGNYVRTALTYLIFRLQLQPSQWIHR